LYSSYKKKDILGAIKQIEDISLKDEETFNYLQYLFMHDRQFNNIRVVEQARNRMKQNANEDIVKQSLNIKIMKEGV
jgi:hypothetical protein